MCTDLTDRHSCTNVKQSGLEPIEVKQAYIYVLKKQFLQILYWYQHTLGAKQQTPTGNFTMQSSQQWNPPGQAYLLPPNY